MEEIVEVEVAVSRPGRPACAFDAPLMHLKREASQRESSLVTSRKVVTAARLPRSHQLEKHRH